MSYYGNDGSVEAKSIDTKDINEITDNIKGDSEIKYGYNYKKLILGLLIGFIILFLLDFISRISKL